MISLAELRTTAKLLESHPFVFAKTMPENPHWYTERRKWADQDAFDRVLKTIRTQGYKEKFRNTWYTQLDVNNYFYWAMGGNYLINRKDIAKPVPYDAIADKYDALFQSAEDKALDKDVLNLVGPLYRTVLDIGCGTGWLLDNTELAPQLYTGIDPSRRMLAHFEQKHPGYKTVTSTFEAFAGAKYDNVIALFGTASYLLPQALDRVPEMLTETGRYLLMFYKPGYNPVTYRRAGTEAQFYHYDPDFLPAKAQVSELGPYFVVQGKAE